MKTDASANNASFTSSLMAKSSSILGSKGAATYQKSISPRYINLCCVGSLLFGYGISCMNTMKDTMGHEFGWNVTTLHRNFSILSTALFAAAAVGAFSGGMISQFGRRTLHQSLHGVFILGAVLSAFANGFGMLLAGRLFTGLGVGLVCVSSPMIISEISPLKSRGANGVWHQLSITVGILIGIDIGIPLKMTAGQVPHGMYMRGMFALPVLFSGYAILCLIFWLKEETPSYLVGKGRKEETVNLLRAIYSKHDVEAEYQVLAMDQHKENTPSVSLIGALQDAWYRKALIVGVVLAMAQQLTGVNAFVSLSSQIFKNAGLDGSYLTAANVGMAVINFMMTFPAIYIIDSFGRRPLLLLGMAGQTVSLFLVPLVVLIAPTLLPIMSAVSVIGYVICFAVSSGPVVWVYLNEIFPVEIHGPACGLCAALNQVSGIIVVFLVSRFGHPDNTIKIFAAFGVVSCIATVYGVFFLKETSGRSNANSPYLEGRIADPCEQRLNTSKADRYC